MLMRMKAVWLRINLDWSAKEVDDDRYKSLKLLPNEMRRSCKRLIQIPEVSGEWDETNLPKIGTNPKITCEEMRRSYQRLIQIPEVTDEDMRRSCQRLIQIPEVSGEWDETKLPKFTILCSLSIHTFEENMNCESLEQLLHSKMAVFCVVSPCRLVWVYQRFRGLYCLHHQEVSTQKIVILTFATVTTSNHAVLLLISYSFKKNLYDLFAIWHVVRSKSIVST
jgi:hypothetical protein